MSRLTAVSLISPLVLLLAGCFSQAPVTTVTPEPVSKRSAPVVTAPPAQAADLGPGYYTVKKGDTLYRIALENGQDYREIAAWNNLSNPSSIKEGQVLRVLPPGSERGGVVAKPITAPAAVEAKPLGRQDVVADANMKRGPKVGKEPYTESGRPAEKVEAKPEVKADVKSEPKPESKSETVAAAPDEVNWGWPANGKLIGSFNDSAKGLDIAGKAGDPVLAAGDGKVVYAGSGLRGYGQLVIVKHNGTYLSAYAHNQKILVKEGQQVTKGQRIAEMGNSDADVVKLHFEIRRQGKPTDPTAYLPKR